ncbi:hypothetical protein [Luteolibacter sp. LG18]|uniref:hypothetical protein n=1 Tax=Luteolibacter sp. LG18 TaxID=2819286 RepID=UPI002B2E8328|nr:hypothetical protein llg_15500 [Luteolibacter sp. LG18]
MSKTKVIVGLAAAILLGLVVWQWPRGHQPETPPLSTAAPRASMMPAAVVPPPVITVLPIAADMARLNAPDALPQDDLSMLSMLLTTYGRNQGGHPTGENEEITAALLGRNPKHLAYLPANAPFVNVAGQLIDRWGTPYFFHSMTADRTDIRSAGPDRELWTADDIESSH